MASEVEQGLQRKTVIELRALLRAANLSTSGLKQDLIDRLINARHLGLLPASPPRTLASPIRAASPVRAASPIRTTTFAQFLPLTDAKIVQMGWGQTDPQRSTINAGDFKITADDYFGPKVFTWMVDHGEIRMYTPAARAIQRGYNQLFKENDRRAEDFEDRYYNLLEQEKALRRNGQLLMGLEYHYLRDLMVPQLVPLTDAIIVNRFEVPGPEGDVKLAHITIKTPNRRPLNLLDVILKVHQYWTYADQTMTSVLPTRAIPNQYWGWLQLDGIVDGRLYYAVSRREVIPSSHDTSSDGSWLRRPYVK